LQDYIYVKGARSNNLKNLDVKIPKNQLVIITGVSGSGKSSLAFDTIYAEGQRKYVESLSAYARQFLGLMDKPDVDYITGLSPAISIDQKTAGHNPRSTVGTITEIYDYLRLLFARVGHPHSPSTGRRLKSQSVQEIVDAIFNYPKKYSKEVKIIILAPVVKNRKGTYDELFTRFLAQGYTRARIDKEYYSLEESINLDRYKAHNIELVVDRLIIKENDQSLADSQKRLTDSVETAVNLAQGELLIDLIDEKHDDYYSEKLVDPETGESFPQVEPHSFSFNSPYGACPRCNGLGFIKDINPDLIYNPNLSITEGAIYPWQRIIDNQDSWQMQILKAVARDEGFDLRKEIAQMSKENLNIVLYGSGTKKYSFNYLRQSDGKRSDYSSKFEGVIPYLLKRYAESESEYVRADIEQYMSESHCPVCLGKRLKATTLAVTINRQNIYDVGQLPISSLLDWVNSLTTIDDEIEGDGLTAQELKIANLVLKEIFTRIKFLLAVGLNYLSLNRSARTLSGGESQRIRLASQIGTGLTGVLYVLDEPSIGLHQNDNDKLLKSLKELRDLGNSVIIVEHDEDTIKQSDYIIDIGPGAGEHGGNVVAQGILADFIKSDSITAKYISGEIKITREIIDESVKKILAKQEISKSKKISYLTIKGAKQNNLKNITVNFPLQKFVAVTGVSGSGKSSLINDILYPALMQKIYKSKYPIGEYEGLEGYEDIDKLVGIDQSPIGRTPRSNAATYTGLFVQIRELFALTKEAQTRGYKAGRFSFNTKGGRCENCKGDGVLKIEMQFLPDVYVTCDVCNGQRYNRETLQVIYRGKNIAEVLNMTVEEGHDFFKNIPLIFNKLKVLTEVGLNYIRLGQSATTLSGGEAQRVKLATELSKRSTGNTLYILDEPTTGLHFDDVKKLLIVLHSLVAKGNSVIVIEHNLDVVKTADWVIDLGPEGGDKGGQIIAIGTPQDIENNPKSLTGKWLKIITEQ